MDAGSSRSQLNFPQFLLDLQQSLPHLSFAAICPASPYSNPSQPSSHHYPANSPHFSVLSFTLPPHPFCMQLFFIASMACCSVSSVHQTLLELPNIQWDPASLRLGKCNRPHSFPPMNCTVDRRTAWQTPCYAILQKPAQGRICIFMKDTRSQDYQTDKQIPFSSE